MNRMIAMCGLDCNVCIAFIATQKDDNNLKEKVVEAWSTGEDHIRLEDVDCDGCTAGKRLHSFCQVCEVRECGLQRDNENCGYCNEFPCGKLEKLWEGFQTVSREEAKANLIELRRRNSVGISPET
jgi:hypothetical protein